MRRLFTLMVAGLLLPAAGAWAIDAPDPAAIIQASFHHYRGKASESDVEMVIHRTAWQRSHAHACLDQRDR
jgi:hypothetical protein